MNEDDDQRKPKEAAAGAMVWATQTSRLQNVTI